MVGFTIFNKRESDFHIFLGNRLEGPFSQKKKARVGMVGE